MSIWYRRYPASETTRLRLVCLPNAGGVATFYRDWPPALPEDVELLAVRYPGRQERWSEPLIDRMDQLAEAVADALEPALDLPVALFGHSLGASVAHEVALRLGTGAGVWPVLLVLSAGRAPSQGSPPHPPLTDDALIAEIGRLGGVDPAVLDDRDLRALILPALRADYRLRAEYVPSRQPVACPVVAYGGDDDPECPVASTKSWADIAAAGFDYRIFAGDHFYLVSRQAEVLRDLSERLRAAIPARRPPAHSDRPGG